MTYKLEPWVGKIKSLVTVILPNGEMRRYLNGSVAASDIFDKHYIVTEISAVGGDIILTLQILSMPDNNWIGEEQQGFF